MKKPADAHEDIHRFAARMQDGTSTFIARGSFPG